MIPPHEISDPYLIIQTLGFGAGVVMSALLLALLWRSPTNQSNRRAKYLQAIFALMWNAGGLAGEGLQILGTSPQSKLLIFVSLVNFSGAAFFPISFLALWQRPRDENSLRAKACQYLCNIAMINAALLTVLFLSTCTGPFRPAGQASLGIHGAWKFGELLSYHVAITMLAGTFLLLRGRLNTFAARFYAATTLIGVLVPAGLEVLLRLFGWLTQLPKQCFIAIEQQAPLLILFGAVVYFGDFRFSNVYVKFGLRFLTALLFALSFCLGLVFVVPPVAERFANFPLAAKIVLGTALLTTMLLHFSRLVPNLNRLVDRYLFRQPDYAALTRDVWQRLSQKTETEEIFAIASVLARETLALESVRTVSLQSLDAGHLIGPLSSGEILELSANDRLRLSLGDEIEFLMPIRVNGQPTHALAIAPGPQRRNLLDSELAFLRGLAGQVGSRLEALLFEKERIERQSLEERLARQVTEAELRALRAQINPHFLFNSLNTIADLIIADPANAERMTVQLAKIFRHVLSSSDRQMISIGEEMEFLETWLAIERVRFGDRLQVQFEIDESLVAESVPSLILQPLVENALKHGLAPKIDGGRLQVSAERENEMVCLAVEDNGLGFPEPNGSGGETRARKGIGLRNVAERLTTIYAGRAQMRCEAVDAGGSRVVLLLPRLKGEAA